jgi:hypothetical protein
VALLPDEVLPGGDPAVGGYIALMFIGFVVGIAGHIVRSKTLIATGIGLIFMAVIVLPLIFLGGGG